MLMIEDGEQGPWSAIPFDFEINSTSQVMESMSSRYNMEMIQNIGETCLSVRI